MDAVVTLFYILFVICVVYPPTEFVAAGFTIDQIFDNYLGSENVNFVGYHMKRITITILLHSLLPMGYIITLWLGGSTNEWLLAIGALTAVPPCLAAYMIVTWWEDDRKNNPVVKMLSKYAAEGTNWKIVASNLNVEFRSVDKVSVQLTSTSKFVATATFLIKVTQYKLFVVPQNECSLVATGTDSHNITQSGEEEIQFVNMDAIPARDELPRFSIRMTATALRELQPRLVNQVVMPEHLSLQPTLIERFVGVFKYHVEQNPVYYVDDIPELCIGCMQARADVKINRRCHEIPLDHIPGEEELPCQQCNCRVLWCCGCLSRWWASRSASGPGGWLAARGSCPVCRAVFCLLDVSPARLRPRPV